MTIHRDEERKAQGLHRRDVLRGLGVVGVAAAGAGAAAGVPEAAEAAETGADQRAGRYRESAHVVRYYELSRF
jgi:hypothetical protein